MFAKGAPGMLLERSTHELTGRETRPLTQERRVETLSLTEALAAEALRTLGVAFRPLEPAIPRLVAINWSANSSFWADWHDRSAQGGGVCRRSSGQGRRHPADPDHGRPLGHSCRVAREVGITSEDRVLTGAQLDAMSEQELKASAREVAVYARVSPHHKLARGDERWC